MICNYSMYTCVVCRHETVIYIFFLMIGLIARYTLSERTAMFRGFFYYIYIFMICDYSMYVLCVDMKQ